MDWYRCGLASYQKSTLNLMDLSFFWYTKYEISLNRFAENLNSYHLYLLQQKKRGPLWQNFFCLVSNSTINKFKLIEYLFHKFPELVCHCHKGYNWQFQIPYYPFRATDPRRKVLLNLYHLLSHIWLWVEPKQNTFSC